MDCFKYYLEQLPDNLKHDSAIKIQHAWDRYFQEYLCEVKYRCWSSSDDEENIEWVESLGKNIIKSVTLEIGNPMDGYNYIKKVITNDELKK